MTTWERLTEVFDKGCQHGVDALTPRERELYLIQDFILEFEMNSLSGYFYNRLPDVALIQEAIDSMNRHGFAKLAKILTEGLDLFRNYVDPDPPTTWQVVRQRYDPSNRLDLLEQRINKLKDYGFSAKKK